MDQNKLKVLFIAKNVPVKGIHFSRIVIDIAHKISAFCEVAFLYPNETVPFGFHFLKKYKPFYRLKSWDFEGFHISVTNYIRFPFRKMAFWFWNKLSKNDIKFYNQTGPFDLIHAHYLFPDGYLAYLYSKKYNIPYLITIRNADIRHLKSISKRNPDVKKAMLIIWNAQKVLSLNLSYKEFVDDLFGISSIIIPHGIEESAYFEGKTDRQNKVKITTVSEAIKRKNINWIIKAVYNYKGKQEIELNVIGSGPLMNELKQLANDDKRINFLGKIDRSAVLKHLQDSDIFALPSFDESFGLVYLEAAATKNAIIGFKHEGVWGIFEDQHEMFFSENEEHFQKILHNLIDDQALRTKLQQAAFNKAKKLRWDNITKLYKQVYEESIHTFKVTPGNSFIE